MREPKLDHRLAARRAHPVRRDLDLSGARCADDFAPARQPAPVNRLGDHSPRLDASSLRAALHRAAISPLARQFADRGDAGHAHRRGAGLDRRLCLQPLPLRRPQGTMLAILTTQMFPATMLLLPLYILIAKLHLVNTFLGLTVFYVSTALPFCVWQMKGFYDTIPASLEEAARIDGCSQWRAFWSVILPLARRVW